MYDSSSPLKLAPSSPKKRRKSSNFMHCLICQKPSTERLSQFTSIGKSTFVSAMNKRLDEVYSRVLDEFGSFDTCAFEEMQAVYHRSCYKSYTSKHNCSPFKSDEATCLTYNDDRQLSDCCPSVSGFCTRSRIQSFDWNSCIFCCKKTFKKDRKLRKFQ